MVTVGVPYMDTQMQLFSAASHYVQPMCPIKRAHTQQENIMQSYACTQQDQLVLNLLNQATQQQFSSTKHCLLQPNYSSFNSTKHCLLQIDELAKTMQIPVLPHPSWSPKIRKCRLNNSPGAVVTRSNIRQGAICRNRSNHP